jgi:hypothetical protein
MQTSARNSRLAFGLEAPETDGWKTKGYIESDFFGFEPSPGAGSVANTEASYFNNAALRLRHGYIQAENGGWLLLAGQTWEMLGWQPYYFMTTVDVAPVSGMLYNRTQQLRGIRSYSFGEDTLQVGFGLLRPPQADAGIPDVQGGLRLAFNGRQSGFTAGGSTAARSLQPMSIAVSGAFRQFVAQSSSVGDLDRFSGSAIAIDALIPILASPDGKTANNTLSLLGEFTQGTGYGDQFNSYTGGILQPLNTSATSATQRSNTNLDAGNGDYDATGAFQLVNLRSFNIHAQYHLPGESLDFVDVGFGQLESNNIDSIKGATGLASGGNVPYDRSTAYFANYVHGFTPNIRAGIEYAYMETSYADGTLATNRRYQASGWFLF